MIREKDIEQALIREIRKQGGLCLKWVSPGWSGAPDRICLLPNGKVAFAEVKKPGEKPRPLQIRRMEQLRVLGFTVTVIDTVEKAVSFAEKIGSAAQSGGGGDAYS